MTKIADKNAMRSRIASTGVAIAMVALAGHQGHALDAAERAGERTSEFIIINVDDPGEGLNDPTPVEPVGGNEGMTLGEQRLNVFKSAVRVWEHILVSDVPIEFEAQFDELFCDEESAILGSAGPNSAAADFSGALLPDTLYVAAQANQQAGFDLDPDQADLGAVSTACWAPIRTASRASPSISALRAGPHPRARSACSTPSCMKSPTASAF